MDHKASVPKFKRGHFSVLFDAAAQPASLVLADHSKQTFLNMTKERKQRKPDSDSEVCHTSFSIFGSPCHGSRVMLFFLLPSIQLYQLVTQTTYWNELLHAILCPFSMHVACPAALLQGDGKRLLTCCKCAKNISCYVVDPCGDQQCHYMKEKNDLTNGMILGACNVCGAASWL